MSHLPCRPAKKVCLCDGTGCRGAAAAPRGPLGAPPQQLRVDSAAVQEHATAAAVVGGHGDDAATASALVATVRSLRLVAAEAVAAFGGPRAMGAFVGVPCEEIRATAPAIARCGSLFTVLHTLLTSYAGAPL